MADERMQTGRGVKPVIGNTRLPRMTDEPLEPLEPTPIKGKTLLMATKLKADTGTTRRMPAFSKATVRQPRTRPEMEAGPRREPAGYVRMRLRVSESGRLSVVGAKAVKGPLVESKLQGAMAYEVTLAGAPVSAGSIPDVGEQRSFPDPDATIPEMRGHHITELSTYEVNVRVPKEQVKAAQLPKLEVALFRIKEGLPDEAPALAAAAEKPLGEHFERELREVGRLKGVKPSKLAKPVADELKKAFK